MQSLIETHNRLIDQLGNPLARPLEQHINWANRLIAIHGARGVGKTTLLLKTIRDTYRDAKESLYVSLDNLYFMENTLVDLADAFYKKAGKVLFLDEAHKLERWSQQIKNIYDSYPQLKLVFTGSSALDLLKGQADLSRRVVIYNLSGFSLREYLQIETGQTFETYTLAQIVDNHESIARSIVKKVRPLAHFADYLQHGYYPFYLEGIDTYDQRLTNVINLILEVDLPQCQNIDLKYISKLKKLLYLVAISAPMKPNVSKLSASIEVSRQTVGLYLDYLQRAELIHQIRCAKRGHGLLTKPEKILLHNTNLAHVIARQNWHPGNVRETFFVNQVASHAKIEAADQGDFLLDDTWIFEVGGKNKDTHQITGQDNAYIAADDIETGSGKKIPLWLFGFLA